MHSLEKVSKNNFTGGVKQVSRIAVPDANATTLD